MEGYIYKKGRGDSSFGRRSWKKRWFVLEGQQLSYYEELDPVSNEPVGYKDTLDLSGCTCAPFAHHEKKLTFHIKSETIDLYLQAIDQKSFQIWIKEISAAGKGENIDKEMSIADCLVLLGLNADDEPDQGEVNRAYRKTALRSHPDKGGNIDQFKLIQDAYNQLNKMFQDREDSQLYEDIFYDAVVVKSAGTTGLGLSVMQEQETKLIKIKELLPGIIIRSLTPTAGGTMNVGDVLVAVRRENVLKMPLLRVAQKLNEARVPTNSEVKLTFRRRVRKDNDPDAYSIDENINENVAEADSRPKSVNSPRENADAKSTRDSGKIMTFSRSDSAFVGKSNISDSDMEDMKSELEAKSKTLTDLEIENIRMKRMLKRFKGMLNDSSTKQKQLDTKLTESRLTKEQITLSMTLMTNTSRKIINQQSIELTSEIAAILEAENLTADSIKSYPIKLAQRNAIIAGASVDIAGSLFYKPDRHISLTEKLDRFEDRLYLWDTTKFVKSMRYVGPSSGDSSTLHSASVDTTASSTARRKDTFIGIGAPPPSMSGPGKVAVRKPLVSSSPSPSTGFQ